MTSEGTVSPRPAERSGREVSAHHPVYYPVLEASPNAVVAVDEHARITYANPNVQSTFGYAPAELIGQPVEVLLPEQLAERHTAHRDGFMRHPVARPMGIGLDLAGRRKDGAEFPVEISLSPVETTDGHRVFATIVDITARKAMENQLLQALKLESIGRLAGGIAHDFNNMLFAIRGYTELLEEDLGTERVDRDEALRNVRAIANAADRATELTSQLLSFSRQQVVSPKVVDLNTTIETLEPMVRRLIGEHLELRLRFDPEAGRIRADSGQLDQIVINLVVNARDAMPDGGAITIETANVVFDEPYATEHFDVLPGPYVMLAVSDTGIGMEREVREHVFEPFYTTKEHGKGTGLGLATIYGIVRQAGGHIWLYSEPGHGSTFKLYFPRVDAAASEEPEAISPEPVLASGTVLVVEDEPSVRDMTSRLLERAGYQVIAVPDGAGALAAVEAGDGPIDVLVTDVIMPDITGIQLAELILERYPAMGVVLLSGYTSETFDLERLTARGARFLAKPMSSGQLLRAIQGARPVSSAPD